MFVWWIQFQQFIGHSPWELVGNSILTSIRPRVEVADGGTWGLPAKMWVPTTHQPNGALMNAMQRLEGWLNEIAARKREAPWQDCVLRMFARAKDTGG